MPKLPFLIRHAFKIEDKVQDKSLIVEMTPKKNLWFYLFAFVESFKYIVNEFKGYKTCEDIDKRVADFIFDKTRMPDGKNKFCVIGSSKDEKKYEITWVDTFRDAGECYLRCKADKKQIVIANADNKDKQFVLVESESNNE